MRVTVSVEGLQDGHLGRRGGVADPPASVALLADGFSVSTCLPAATAARFQGPWLLASGL